MKKIIPIAIVALAAAGVVGFVVLTSPLTWSLTHPTRDVADSTPPNLENGKTMFLAGDCSTCHSSPNQDNELLLGGGRTLNTAFGTFHMPNISSDPKDGVGGWTLAQFTRAVREGVGPGGIMPDGQNLYPAFPYTSYQRMSANDVKDMFAYIRTLPAKAGRAPDHDLKFPYTMRRGVGVWRLAFLDGKPVEGTPATNAALNRGRYLVEGSEHCAECHSPRGFMGNIPAGQRYSGGPDLEGTGYFPNITPDETGIGYWTVSEIADYLKIGISPISKRAGGDMAKVVANTSQLSDDDRHAIALYMKTIPAVDKPNRGMPEPNYTPKVVMLSKDRGGGQKQEAMPTSTATEIGKADAVYAAKTKVVYLDKATLAAKGTEDGKVLGAAKLNVVARDGNLVQVRIDGWQLQGAESVFYAQQGQRIMVALMTPEAVAKVVRNKTVTDPDTKQEWYQVSLTVWTDGENLNVQLPALWDYSQNLFSSTCSVCHSLPEPGHFLANQWIGNLNAMKRFTSINDDQYRLLLAYLQNHSKDVGPEAGK